MSVRTMACIRCLELIVVNDHARHAKYCPECAKAVNREKQKMRERERRARAKASQSGQKNCKKTIAQVAVAARAQGLSYGQYVAKYLE